VFAKLFILIIFLLSFGNPSEENKNYHKEHYATGTIKAEGWLKNGQKEGYWRFYHQNGKVSEQGEYKNNQRVKYWYSTKTKR